MKRRILPAVLTAALLVTLCACTSGRKIQAEIDKYTENVYAAVYAQLEAQDVIGNIVSEGTLRAEIAERVTESYTLVSEQLKAQNRLDHLETYMNLFSADIETEFLSKYGNPR